MNLNDYGILIRVSAESLKANVDIKDAEYYFIGSTVPKARGKEMINQASEEDPTRAWGNVKIAFPEKGKRTIYIWVRAIPVTDDTALANSRSIESSISDYYRSQAKDMLEGLGDADERTIDDLMDIYDVGTKAMKQEARKKWGAKDDDDGPLNDGDKTDMSIDDMINQVEGKMKESSDGDKDKED